MIWLAVFATVAFVLSRLAWWPAARHRAKGPKPTVRAAASFLVVVLTAGAVPAMHTATYAYDVPTVARIDVRTSGDVESGSAQFVGMREGSVSPEGRSTTPDAPVVATNRSGSTFYTVQSADDAARLASGGSPWPTSPTRAEFGPGVYAWDNADSAANYASQLEELHGVCVQVCEFSIDTGGLRHVDVDSLVDPDDFMSKNSQLWLADPNHGLDYITRGTQFGTQHYFSPQAFASATWHGAR